MYIKPDYELGVRESVNAIRAEVARHPSAAQGMAVTQGKGVWTDATFRDSKFLLTNKDFKGKTHRREFNTLSAVLIASSNINSWEWRIWRILPTGKRELVVRS